MPSDVDTGKKQKGKESQPDDEDEDTSEGLKGNFLEDDDDDIAEIDSEEVEVEAEVEGPQMEENVLQSTGAMITKFEVFVSFLQVYGIIFNFDLTIDWPINFKLFNMWFMWMPTLFLMDLSFLIDAFGFSIPADYFVYIKYIGTILVFILIVISYTIFKGWSRRRFLIYGIKKWSKTKKKYLRILFVLVILSGMVAIALEGEKSIVPIYEYFNSGGQRGGGPTLRTIVWFVFFVCVIVFLYLIVFIAIWIMRRSYFKDKTEEKKN